jgi:hypothetical protein
LSLKKKLDKSKSPVKKKKQIVKTEINLKAVEKSLQKESRSMLKILEKEK